MHAITVHLNTARHALLAAAAAEPFPERDELVGILARVGKIAETNAARASAPPSTPAANDPAREHVCPFAACADTGLLATGEVCACTAVELRDVE
jgi:hypothetical protein